MITFASFSSLFALVRIIFTPSGTVILLSAVISAPTMIVSSSPGCKLSIYAFMEAQS